MKVPFLRPSIEQEDIDAMTASIKTGWLVHGEYTKRFEENFAKALGVQHAVMMGSCTAALHSALIVAGVGEGDEVITTPMSWVATSNIALYQKATPVFVDIELETGLIDISKIEEKITSKTKAIVIVHIYGQMMDMVALKKIADKHNLKIIEDSAHAVEARRDDVAPGQLGFAAAFSFHAAKNITAGQGGMFVTNSDEVAEQARLLRRDGVKNIDGKRRMYLLGHKYDATDYQAALMIGQLGRISKTHADRLRVYDAYVSGFKNNSKISFPKQVPNSVHAAHMFVVFVDPSQRDTIRKGLDERGIDTSIHYEPIHMEPYYRETFGYKTGDFPNTEKLGASIITLPTYGRLTAEEQEYVIAAVNELA